MKKPIILILIFLSLFVGIVFLFPGIMDNQSFTEKIKFERDLHNFDQLKIVKNFLNNNNKIKFENINEFNLKSGKNIYPSKTCIFLKSFEGNNKYVFSFKFESNENIAKYGNEYFIFKSKEDIQISENELNNIIKTISNYCK